MDQATKELLIKRLKSFAWRSFSMLVVAGMAFIVENLGMFKLPGWTTALIGLIAGETTKWFNNHTTLFGAKLK